MKKQLWGVMMAMMMTVSAHAQTSVKTVGSVDLDRYAGKWFEIARFPNRFQTQCAGEVSAEYRRRSDGNVDVVNHCRRSEGKFEQAVGLARVVKDSGNAKLKVRFAPAWLSWLPLVWGDYWVIALAPDYSWAVVGEGQREYLWVLARTPKLPDAHYQEAVQQAAKQGFDVNKLVKTQQK